MLCYKQVTVDQYHSRSSHIFIQRRALQFNIATRGYQIKEKELTRIEILVRELLLLRRLTMIHIIIIIIIIIIIVVVVVVVVAVVENIRK